MARHGAWPGQMFFMLQRMRWRSPRKTLRVRSPLNWQSPRQARREWQLSVDQFRWHAEEPRILWRISRAERLVADLRCFMNLLDCCAFTAWNFPAVLIARKVAPALAAGCSISCAPRLRCRASQC